MLTAMAVELLSKHPGETPAGGVCPTPWLPPMKLLLIEDNPALQATLKRSFERRGIQGVGCDDGARAPDRWHASQHDVVLLDLNLPGLDGLPVLSQARAPGPGHAGRHPDRPGHGGRPHPGPEHRRR